MALLQIAEPGLSAAPHQHRLAIGIDLGTTNSLVASVKSGVAVCLTDEHQRPTLPSVVRYGSGNDIEVGYDALKAQKTDPLNTISSALAFILFISLTHFVRFCTFNSSVTPCFSAICSISISTCSLLS